MNKLYTQHEGLNYLAPAIEIIDVSVEKGFAVSVKYGDFGEAGNNFGSDDFGDF